MIHLCPIPYLSPTPIYERVKIDQFVGRAWLIDAFDAFCAHTDRGYFIIEAEPGVGATSLVAHLATQRNYIHLFVEQARGIDNVANGIRSLAVQLIRRWQLHHLFSDDIVPGIAVQPDFLGRLLYIAAGRRDQMQPREPIVVVIDGLHNAGSFPAQQALGLPTALPMGVYILATQRIGTPCLVTGSPMAMMQLHASDPRNQHDMRLFLQQQRTHPPYHTVLAHETVADVVLQRCGGVWLLLSHVLDRLHQQYNNHNDAVTAHAITTSVQQIPTTLEAYYAWYWQQQREQFADTWQPILLPVLATLCILYERVSFTLLCHLAGIDTTQHTQHHVQSVLEQQWQPFVVCETWQQQTTYTWCNSALQRLLQQDDVWLQHTDNDSLNTQYADCIDELYHAVQQAHHRIAYRYLTLWGGLNDNLPRLAEPAFRDLDEGYGLRHVVAHLIGARQYTEVHRLLQVQWHTTPQHDDTHQLPWLTWLEQLFLGKQHYPTHHALAWFATREQEGDLADFHSDVVQAWYLVADARCCPVNIGLQARYALIQTSLHDLSNNIPIALIKALLERDLWHPEQVLTYIRLMDDTVQQAAALEVVAPYVPYRLMNDALAIARTIREERDRARGLAGVAIHLPADLLPVALAVARSISHPSWRATALVGLLPHLATEEWYRTVTEALEATRTVWHASVRVESLLVLVPHLPEELLHHALDIAQTVLDNEWRIRALIGVARYLPLPLLRDALAMWESWGSHWRAKLLAELAPRMDELGLISQSFHALHAIHNEQERAVALCGLAPYLSEIQLNDAVTMVYAMQQEEQCVRAVVGIARYLPRILLWDILTHVQTLSSTVCRVRAVAGIMPSLPAAQHPPLLDSMMHDSMSIADTHERVTLLSELAYTLAEQGYFDAASKAIEQIVGNRERTLVLAQLAPFLTQPLLQHVLETIPTIEDSVLRSQTIAKIAPYLPIDLLPHALVAARAIGDGKDRARVLAQLAAYVSPTLVYHIYAEATTIGCEAYRAEVLALLIPSLPDALLRDVVPVIQAIEREDHRATVITAFAARIPKNMRHAQTVMQLVQAMHHSHDTCQALSGAVAYLPDAMMPDVLRLALSAEHEEDIASLLVHIIHRLPISSIPHIRTAVRTFKTLQCRDRVFVQMVVVLGNAKQIDQALDTAWSIGKTIDRARTVVQLIAHCNNKQRDTILSIIRGVGQQDILAQLLAMVVSFVDATVYPLMVTHMIRAAAAARWQHDASPALIAPHITDAISLRQIVASIRMIDSPEERALALAEVSPFLAMPLQQEVVREAVAVTRLIWGQYRAGALAAIATLLPTHYIEDVYHEVQSLEQTEWRVHVLVELLPVLPAHLWHECLDEPLAAARHVWNPIEAVRAMARLLPYMPETERVDVLTDMVHKACSIEESTPRNDALRCCSNALAQLPPDVLYPVWHNTLQLLAMASRNELMPALVVLMPVVVRLGGTTAADDIAQAILDVGEWFG